MLISDVSKIVDLFIPEDKIYVENKVIKSVEEEIEQ
jgi:hypothetical protein